MKTMKSVVKLIDGRYYKIRVSCCSYPTRDYDEKSTMIICKHIGDNTFVDSNGFIYSSSVIKVIREVKRGAQKKESYN